MSDDREYEDRCRREQITTVENRGVCYICHYGDAAINIDDGNCESEGERNCNIMLCARCVNHAASLLIEKYRNREVKEGT